MNTSNPWIRVWQEENPSNPIEWCVVKTTETETLVINEWRKKSEHELNMERLSKLCHGSWLRKIERG